MSEGITKEQAIEYFKFHRKIFCEDHLKICPKDSIAYQATLKEKEFYDMAIKALEQEGYYKDLAQSYEKTIAKLTEAIAEQQPCEDAISRQALISAFPISDFYILDDIIATIKFQPPVTPTQRWIPMVRREPTDEEKTEHLAQNGEELCYVLENEMPLHGQEVLVSIGEFVSEDVFDEDFYNFESAELSDVDAWMPKPKGYKAERKSE